MIIAFLCKSNEIIRKFTIFALNRSDIVGLKIFYTVIMAQHNELGTLGERYAIDFLEKKGYRILHQNWRVGHKELDIVALHSGEIIFVEVKTRRTDQYGNPEDFVDDKKIRRIISAADAYMRYHNFSAPVRFDIISVLIQRDKVDIRHIEEAFDILPE